ncbi:MAG: CoA pyrophosphatase [Oligoflexia bacterium]|nr:CoA pyrophosphatase [Oligoflexia bacterium]
MALISAENDPLFVNFTQRARAALSLDVPYVDRPPSGELTARAAVMLVFALQSGEPHLLVTRRAESVVNHTGQMAFPGGKCEPEEMSGHHFLETAFRETEEEVGIARADLEVLGQLPPVGVITGFLIEPYVALHRKSMSAIHLVVSAGEISETLWVPWKVLSDPNTYRREAIFRGVTEFQTHVFYYQGHRIWGVTAAMIKNFLDRWEKVR